MSGTVSPTSARDQQCTHCLLYFSKQGIHNHERNCNWDGIDVTEYAERVLGEAADGVSGDSEPEAPDTSPSDSDELADDAVSGTDAEVPDTPDVEATTETPAETARTDGAGLGLDGPPEQPADDDGEQDDDPDGLACNACDDPLGVTEEELREEHGRAARLTCECGHVMRWTA